MILAGERAAGLTAMERSLALNPNSALAWCFFGWAQIYDTRSAQAIQALQQALRLSPRDPQPWLFYGGLAHAHFAVGRCEEAIEWADRALQAQPRMTAVVGIRAAACAQLGRVEEGREYLRRLCALLRPGWSTIAGIRQGWGKFVSPEFLATWLDGLRKAGLPEE